jgi:hypothetical protein
MKNIRITENILAKGARTGDIFLPAVSEHSVTIYTARVNAK